MTLSSYSRVLITGGSSGIGAELARQLGRRGMSVLLVARHEQRLREQVELLRADAIEARYFICDLLKISSRDDLCQKLRSEKIDLLINCAGFGKIGPFESIGIDDQLNMIELNIKALVHLSHSFVSFHKKNQTSGAILNIASTAAFQPLPLFATYAASKSFVREFSEALRLECEGTGIRIAVASPGPTQSNFFENAGDGGAISEKQMDVSKAVHLILEAFEKGQSDIIPGIMNRLQHTAVQFFPRPLAAWVGGELVAGKKSQSVTSAQKIFHSFFSRKT